MFCIMLGALAGIFSQILHGDEQIRERAITFLSTKIRVLLVEDMLPKDAEEELIAVCKKVKWIVMLFCSLTVIHVCMCVCVRQFQSIYTRLSVF